MQVKKLGYILFVGVIATICILPVAVMPWQTEKAVGNEQLASFPELRKEDGSFNTGILNEFSDYFADHFGLRHEMITLNDQLTGTMLKTLDSSSVLLGKDDWLFYKSTLADYTGAELFTARQSYAAAHVLGLMQEYCEENGIGFCFTIAPNKNSLYRGAFFQYPGKKRFSASFGYCAGLRRVNCGLWKTQLPARSRCFQKNPCIIFAKSLAKDWNII